MKFRNICALSASAFAFASTAACAEAAAVDAGESAAQTSSSDIVVTARRRDEVIDKVPISITAFSQEALENQGIKNIVDLGSKVPSLSVTTAGGFRSFLSFSIRGQRTNEPQLLTDPPVGLYFAEVNQPRTAGFGYALYDLQNVQVLKGVQGTLFGRNMTGGAVLIEPARPTSELEASLKGQIGNYNLRSAEGMINVPLNDWAAVRIAGKINRRDGFITDISNGRDYSNEHYDTFRGSLLLQPGDLTNQLIFDYIRSRTHGTGLVGDFSQNTGALGAYSLLNAFVGRTIPNVPALFGSFAGKTVLFPVSDVAGQIAAQRTIRSSSNPYRIQGTTIGSGSAFDYPNFDNSFPYEYVRNYGITNKTTLYIGDATLKNIFGYRNINLAILGDLDGLPASLISSEQSKKIEEYSEELQLQGNALNNSLHYTLGVFYFRESGRENSTTAQFPELSTALGAPNTALARLTGFRGSGVAESYAGYAAFTYDLSETFKFSGGIRYTHDKRSVVERPVKNITGYGETDFLPIPSSCTFDRSGLDGIVGTSDDIAVSADCGVPAHKSWSAVTYDATLQWEPSEVTNAYLAFRKGFRAGGFSMRASNAATMVPFDPETVYEYEAGIKNRFTVGAGKLRTSFAAFYQDYRNVQEQNPTTINTVNGPQLATVIVNVAKKRIMGLEFEANATVGNLEFGTNFAYVDVKTLKSSAALAANFAQQGIPKTQVGMTASWHIPIGAENGDLVLGGDVTLRSKIHLDDKDVGADQPSYALANLRLDWQNILGSKVSAGAFVTNLTNQFYRVGVLGIVAEAGSGASTYGEPRMYGMSLGYKF